MSKTKKLEFRPYSLYVTEDFLQERLNEGYTEVAFSHEGEWIETWRRRITKMAVCYHPDGKVLAYEHCEIDDLTVIRTIKPFKYTFKNEAEFLDQRVNQFKIRLGEKREITKVLDDLFGWEFR